MRQIVIAGNWKLNKSIRESIDFITLLKREISEVRGVKVIVCPVFTSLSEASDALSGSGAFLGAQDLYWKASGAFTGEVSAPMLKDAGCDYVIIGHSERRQFFAETNETVNNKVKAALEAGLIPIICCGEKLEERESGRTNDVIKDHIEGAFKGVSDSDAKKCIVAYEPVWAIGTGKVATTEQAQDAHSFIRGLLEKLYSKDVSDTVPILYGGSVKPSNSAELISQSDVDGALVGGASLDPAQFTEIIKSALVRTN